MVSPCYCVVCAVRLQFKILWQGYIKKYEKFKVSPTDYNPSVFHRELKKIYGIVPLSPTASPTDHTRQYFIESCKNIYGIVPQSPTGFPTDVRTSRRPRMSDTCPSAKILTDWPTSNTNRFTHIPKRTHVRHVSVCTNTDGFADRSKSLAGFSNFFGAHFN